MDITKILAEHISNTSKEIVLVSTHLTELRELETSATLFKLAQNILDKAGFK